MSAADRELAAELHKAHFERLIGRMYPTAEPRALRGIADIVTWTVLVDDYLDPHHSDYTPDRVDEVQTSVEAALDANDATNHRGLLDSWIASALRSLEPPDDAWLSQLIEHLRDFASAICAEARAHASGTVPSISEYLLHRRETCGWAIVVDLLELQPGTALPNSLRSETATKRMCIPAGEIMSGTNDILSLSKELARGERHNLVLLIQHHDACPLPDAVDRVHAYVSDRTNEYLKCKAEFLDHLARSDPHMYPTGERYTAGLEYLLSGIYDWSITSGRFTAREAEAAEKEAKPTA